MQSLSEKKILLGVTGGIAAYKSAELVRTLTTAGAEVRVVMTASAKAFVGPLTFQALTGYPVHSGLLDVDEEAAMGHIQLSRWADLIVIAPATADCIARLRVGRADDLLTALCLAAEVPILVAPAMNRAMWSHPATQENCAILARRGVHLLGPAEGLQACGETGPGRMLEAEEIGQRIEALCASQSLLKQLRVLITAGPTREAIDPVRYISNRSSGKMGFAIAEAATQAGALVTLVSGPVSLAKPPVAAFIAVESAAEMFEAVMKRAREQDIYIGAAAVADYAPPSTNPHKIKKSESELNLKLHRTRDILASVAALTPGPFTVGFAAETSDVEHYARHKLESKKLDMIVANAVGGSQGGFESDCNQVTCLWNQGRRAFDLAPKNQIARQLIELIAERFLSHQNPPNP